MSRPFVTDNLFKIRYDILNESLEKYKQKRVKMLLTIDIGNILDTFYSITKKTVPIITNQIKTKFIIGIFNIISHYRHYYFDKLGLVNSVILYCGNHDQYEENLELLNDIKEILNFLPGIIYIDYINKDKNNIYFYNHFMCYLVDYYNRLSDKLGYTTVVNVLSDNIIDYQLLKYDNAFIYKPRKQKNQVSNLIDSYENLLNPDIDFNNIKLKMGLKELFIPYNIIFNRGDIKTNLPKISENTLNRAEKLLMIINNNKNPLDLIKEYGSLYYTGNDLIEFINIANNMKFRSNPNIKLFMKTFIEIWNSKIKDKKIYNFNDMVRLFDNDNIKIEWLLEHGVTNG